MIVLTTPLIMLRRHQFARAALSSSKSFSAEAAAAYQFPEYILNVPATEVTTTPKGLRVASEGGHGDITSVGVWIDAGSRYETARNNGAAHFLEHMFFKGTKRRTQRQLEEEIENMGGHLNAYTSREQTVYYAQVFRKDAGRAMDILSDMVQHSLLDEGAIRNERGVILREMEEVNKDEQEVIFDLLHEAAYGNSGLGYTILGPEANIRSLRGADLRDYIATHYTSPRMVVAGAGGVDHRELVQLAEAAFDDLPMVASGSEPPNLGGTTFCSGQQRLANPDIPLTHCAVCFEAVGWTSPHSLPLMAMQVLIGEWNRTMGAGKHMSSGLAQVAAEQDLAHSFTTFTNSYKDTGLFGIYGVTEPGKAQEFWYNGMEAMLRLCENVTEEEVAVARKVLKARMLMSVDGSSMVAEDIGRQMLVYGRRLTPAELFLRVDAVDAAAVRETARALFPGKPVALAALGQVDELPPLDWFKSLT